MKIKIVATIGPASADYAMQEEMVKAGLAVARFNFSHGKHEEFKKWLNNFRQVGLRLQKPIAIIQDLQGPRIRIGSLGKEIVLETGQSVKIGFKEQGFDLFLDNPEIFNDLKPQERMLVKDGVVILRIKAKTADYLEAEVERGGKIEGENSVNLPDSILSLPSLTAKDEGDALFGLEMGVDFFALSFVRKAQDIEDFRKFLITQTRRSLPGIIAKIEKKEAVENIDNILKVVDGIMIARGDLGIEMPREHIPLIQKEIIKKAISLGKPVITATQMLETMVENPLPTRAEVSDVANAILDGTDAVMLSEETAIGKYPLEAVIEMAKIIEHTERFLNLGNWFSRKEIVSEVDVLGQAACDMALKIKAKYIVSVTNSGYTALMIAKHKPQTKILALTPSEITYRQLALIWGVEPMILPNFHTTDELIFQSVDLLKQKNLVSPKDRIVILAGHPAGERGHTNLLKIQIIE